MPPLIYTTGLSGSFKNNLGGPRHRNALPGLVITHKACRWTSGPFCLLSALNGRCFAVPQGQARIAQWLYVLIVESARASRAMFGALAEHMVRSAGRRPVQPTRPP